MTYNRSTLYTYYIYNIHSYFYNVQLCSSIYVSSCIYTYTHTTNKHGHRRRPTDTQTHDLSHSRARTHTHTYVCRHTRLLKHPHTCTYSKEAKRNGAGTRSVGKKGRTLNDVLQDLVRYVAHCTDALPVSVSESPHEISREMLFSARSMLSFEVEMGGQQDWVVTSEGEGAGRLWGAAPWLGNMVGHSFSQLVHRDDFATLHVLWLRTCKACNGGRVHTYANAAPVSAVVRIITFMQQHASQGNLRTCSYQPFELQVLHERFLEFISCTYTYVFVYEIQNTFVHQYTCTTPSSCKINGCTVYSRTLNPLTTHLDK